MILIKKPEEIKIMGQGGRILAKVLDEVVKAVKPGITTEELNRLAESLIFSYGALPAFKGYSPPGEAGKSKGEKQPFPAALCTSVNEQIVHVAPSERKLKEGDIINLDLGVIYPPEHCATCPFSTETCGVTKGMYTDAAVTVGVGKISQEAKKLIETTKKCLGEAIKEIKPGAHLGDISFTIQSIAEKNGFSVIRDLVGHGVGCQLHEPPEIPNFGQKGTGPILKEGMTLALEPMLSTGDYKIKKTPDGFGYQTTDNSPSAHFEHTVAVTKNGCQILTKI